MPVGTPVKAHASGWSVERNRKLAVFRFAQRFRSRRVGNERPSLKNHGRSPSGRPKYYDDESWSKGRDRAAKGVPTMLSLQLKDGEYFTIGNDMYSFLPL